MSHRVSASRPKQIGKPVINVTIKNAKRCGWLFKKARWDFGLFGVCIEGFGGLAIVCNWKFFSKIEDNGVASLLIIYQRALRAFAFWLLHLRQFAGWLRLIVQADAIQHG